MDINGRLRLLRKQQNLTTRAFGASINMTGAAITNMENGLRNVTERTVRDICREYNVNPEWLINGTEPMYADVVGGLDLDEEVKQLARQYTLLNDADRALVKNMVNSLSEKVSLKHVDKS
jgi:transcriptional regulator with XRE-family HTH domain